MDSIYMVFSLPCFFPKPCKRQSLRVRALVERSEDGRDTDDPTCGLPYDKHTRSHMYIHTQFDIDLCIHSSQSMGA